MAGIFVISAGILEIDAMQPELPIQEENDKQNEELFKCSFLKGYKPKSRSFSEKKVKKKVLVEEVRRRGDITFNIVFNEKANTCVVSGKLQESPGLCYKTLGRLWYETNKLSDNLGRVANKMAAQTIFDGHREDVEKIIEMIDNTAEAHNKLLKKYLIMKPTIEEQKEVKNEIKKLISGTKDRSEMGDHPNDQEITEIQEFEMTQAQLDKLIETNLDEQGKRKEINYKLTQIRLKKVINKHLDWLKRFEKWWIGANANDRKSTKSSLSSVMNKVSDKFRMIMNPVSCSSTEHTEAQADAPQTKDIRWCQSKMTESGLTLVQDLYMDKLEYGWNIALKGYTESDWEGTIGVSILHRFVLDDNAIILYRQSYKEEYESEVCICPVERGFEFCFDAKSMVIEGMNQAVDHVPLSKSVIDGIIDGLENVDNLPMLKNWYNEDCATSPLVASNSNRLYKDGTWVQYEPCNGLGSLRVAGHLFCEPLEDPSAIRQQYIPKNLTIITTYDTECWKDYEKLEKANVVCCGRIYKFPELLALNVINLYPKIAIVDDSNYSQEQEEIQDRQWPVVGTTENNTDVDSSEPILTLKEPLQLSDSTVIVFFEGFTVLPLDVSRLSRNVIVLVEPGTIIRTFANRDDLDDIYCNDPQAGVMGNEFREWIELPLNAEIPWD